MTSEVDNSDLSLSGRELDSRADRLSIAGFKIKRRINDGHFKDKKILTGSTKSDCVSFLISVDESTLPENPIRADGRGHAVFGLLT
jgi:hypothetical protein